MKVKPLGRKTYASGFGDHRENNSFVFGSSRGNTRPGLGDYYDEDGNLITTDEDTIPGTVQPGPTLEDLQWGKALNNIAPNITQTMKQTAQPGEDWLATLTRVLQTVTMTEQQRSLFNAQIARAQQGLPPLNIGSNGQIITQGSVNPNTLLMMGALLVGAVVLSKK